MMKEIHLPLLINSTLAGSNSQCKQHKFEDIPELLLNLLASSSLTMQWGIVKRMTSVTANISLPHKFPFHLADEVGEESFWPQK